MLLGVTELVVDKAEVDEVVLELDPEAAAVSSLAPAPATSSRLDGGSPTFAVPFTTSTW
jgi:hypothetical protein